MTTVFRKALGALPRLGVQVLDLGPGTAVVSRRGGYTATKMTDDAWMVGGKRSRTRTPAGGWGLHKAAASGLCARHVAELLANYDVNCVFDVGANKGQYGRQLRELGYRGRIVSFEPVPDALAKLRKAAERDPDWQVHPFALGRSESVEHMHLGWKTMNSLLEPSAYGQQRYKRFADTATTTEVPVRRLDAVMDEAVAGIASPRPYLKMDTQGFDMEVFAGAGERIGEFVGMQSEVAALQLYEGSPHMSEAIAAYEDAGFEITGMYPVTREGATGRVVEFDCVLARAAAAPARPA
ncbi:FkbM family methyltransferase [Streptomyces sp. WMMB 322]|uniref:FkbM family methyltransferase n=1 Tax=Streptomyces sp. WMMB 322 TaxID=1286821 RepID=UPI0006E291C6|nr:FkbM family methyltransferase [Streptomyces sp. WMMB 322]SCK39027.1 methyltransferase, FkbM family [Streptomyces sp. WMMB 322]